MLYQLSTDLPEAPPDDPHKLRHDLEKLTTKLINDVWSFGPADFEASMSLIHKSAWSLPGKIPNVFLRGPDDQWPIVSLLQKAIRRSDYAQATRAAAALTNSKLGRKVLSRLAVILLEDISLPGLPLAALVLQLIATKQEPPWPLLDWIVNQCCKLPKDRSFCDVGSVWDCGNPPFKAAQAAIADAPAAALLDAVMSDKVPLMQRALATRRLATGKKDDKAALAEVLQVMELPMCAIFVMENYRKVHKDEMWTAIPAIWDMASKGGIVVHDGPDPTVAPLVEGVPAYAFDMHCQLGRKSINYFAQGCQPIRAFFKKHPTCIKDTALGYAVFTVEGGNLSHYVDYHGRACIAEETIVEEYRYCNLEPDDAIELVQLVTDNLPHLHEARDAMVTTPMTVGIS